jgi:hypothetical protein
MRKAISPAELEVEDTFDADNRTWVAVDGIQGARGYYIGVWAVDVDDEGIKKCFTCWSHQRVLKHMA